MDLSKQGSHHFIWSICIIFLLHLSSILLLILLIQNTMIFCLIYPRGCFRRVGKKICEPCYAKLIQYSFHLLEKQLQPLILMIDPTRMIDKAISLKISSPPRTHHCIFCLLYLFEVLSMFFRSFSKHTIKLKLPWLPFVLHLSVLII